MSALLRLQVLIVLGEFTLEWKHNFPLLFRQHRFSKLLLHFRHALLCGDTCFVPLRRGLLTYAWQRVCEFVCLCVFSRVKYGELPCFIVTKNGVYSLWLVSHRWLTSSFIFARTCEGLVFVERLCMHAYANLCPYTHTHACGHTCILLCMCVVGCLPLYFIFLSSLYRLCSLHEWSSSICLNASSMICMRKYGS